MENNESNNESKSLSAAQPEPGPADRRAFIKAAVKTAVAGTVVAGIAASAGKAEAATAVTGICGGAVTVPKAVVKAQVMFNKGVPITRQNIIDVLWGIIDGSSCPACGLGGFPGTNDPGTVTQIELGTAYLDGSQVSAVVFTDANNGCP
jgi:hypothetical protein